MSRIHLYMCSFLVSFQLCSSSTNTTVFTSPPATVSSSNLTLQTTTAAPDSSGTAIRASASGNVLNVITTDIVQTTTAAPDSSGTAIRASASGNVLNVSTTEIAPSSSVNVTLSTSVAPGTQATTKFQARMTVDETYRSGYNDSSSAEFKAFTSNFSKNVVNVLRKKLSGIKHVNVTRLSSGSVVVDFDIVVQESSNASVDAIKQTLEAANDLGYTILGNVSVNATDQPSTSSSPSPKTTVTEPPTTKIFRARVTVNETYESEYDDPSSTEFKAFASNFSKNVENVLRKELSGIIRVKVTKLSDGSVVVDFDIVVQQSSNASVDAIKQTLKAGSGNDLGYTILGNVSVTATAQPSTPTTTVTGSTKATEIWDKAIELATPLGTFIIVVVAVALILILLIVLICVCCKYARLKKKTRFPEHMAINDSEWIRSSDDLLMWERNLRASEVKTTNGVSSRPVNDKRT